MKTDYLALAEDFFEGIKQAMEEQSSPHRRAILKNFLEHAALEYSEDRWPEILSPERTVEHPIYHIRLGSPEVQRYDGRDEVYKFYSMMKEGVQTNELVNVAVADWGFSAFTKAHFFISGEVLARQGAPIDDPSAFYHWETPLVGLYWDYDENARLISENVYDLLPSVYRKMDPADAPTAEQVANLAAKYRPR
jgi:hypothetical protein